MSSPLRPEYTHHNRMNNWCLKTPNPARGTTHRVGRPYAEEPQCIQKLWKKKEQNAQMSLEVGITLKANPKASQRSIEEEKESFFCFFSLKSVGAVRLYSICGVGGTCLYESFQKVYLSIFLRQSLSITWTNCHVLNMEPQVWDPKEKVYTEDSHHIHLGFLPGITSNPWHWKVEPSR